MMNFATDSICDLHTEFNEYDAPEWNSRSIQYCEHSRNKEYLSSVVYQTVYSIGALLTLVKSSSTGREVGM